MIDHGIIEIEGKPAQVFTFPRMPITIQLIQRTVADYYHIPHDEMRSQRRLREYARPRQVGMYLARKLITTPICYPGDKRRVPSSFPMLARHFGKKDHTTILHGVRQIAQLMLTDDNLRAEVELLEERLVA